MSSFTEFQALVLGKLCSIEERISDIEAILGISQSSETDDIESEPEPIETNSDYVGLEDEISDFQKQLNEIKSLFSE